MSRALIENYSGRIFSGSSESKFAYDPHHIRVGAELIQRNAANAITNHTETEYLVESQNHTGYQQVIEEITIDSGSSIKLAHKVFTVGLDLISQANLMNSKVHTFLYDGHGSVRALTGTTAQIVTESGVNQVFTYDAYGVAINFDPSQATTNILYSGEVWEQSIGLQYLRARWFRPATGGFTSFDPFFGKKSDPLSFHKYLYTHGNPVMGVDPSGKTLTSLSFGSIGSAFVSSIRNVAVLSVLTTTVTTTSSGIIYHANGRNPIQGTIYGAKLGASLSLLFSKIHVNKSKAGSEVGNFLLTGIVGSFYKVAFSRGVLENTLLGAPRDFSNSTFDAYEGFTDAVWSESLGGLIDAAGGDSDSLAKLITQVKISVAESIITELASGLTGSKSWNDSLHDGITRIVNQIAYSPFLKQLAKNKLGDQGAEYFLKTYVPLLMAESTLIVPLVEMIGSIIALIPKRK
jgi:RHS repeat-associated protein